MQIIQKIIHLWSRKSISVTNDSLSTFNAKAYASVIKQAADNKSSSVVILDSSIDSFVCCTILAVALDAGYASNVVEVPSSTSPFTVKRTAFSNKGFSNTVIHTDNKIIGVAKNSYGVSRKSVSATTEDFSQLHCRFRSNSQNQ